MPYIKKTDRADFNSLIDTIQNYPARTSGELNYLITSLIQKYEAYKGTNYQTFNDIIGALEGAKLEAYRRKVTPYEEIKLQENGDV